MGPPGTPDSVPFSPNFVDFALFSMELELVVCTLYISKWRLPGVIGGHAGGDLKMDPLVYGSRSDGVETKTSFWHSFLDYDSS